MEAWDTGAGPALPNPLFFDIEAGVLAEVLPEEMERFSDHITVMGSIGFGQEIGQEREGADSSGDWADSYWFPTGLLAVAKK